MDVISAYDDGMAQSAASPNPLLSERDADILEFERTWWSMSGAKEQGIRDRFGMSSTRYYQILNGLLESPAALAHDPLLIKRLRRLRDTRRRARSAARLGYQIAP